MVFGDLNKSVQMCLMSVLINSLESGTLSSDTIVFLLPADTKVYQLSFEGFPLLVLKRIILMF